MTPRSFVDLFLKHPNAANLLMLFTLIFGAAMTYAGLNRQFFPSFDVPVITITVPWPGATSEDVDDNIVAAIEPEVRFIDQIKKTESYSVEGSAVIVLEFETDADMQRALSDVETAVAQVTTLPEDSENPIVSRVGIYDSVTRIVVSGAVPEPALKNIVKNLRDELLAAGVDKIDNYGLREGEIWVEMDPARLRRLGLDIGDISSAISQDSQDLPSGTLEGSVAKQVRSKGLKRTADEIATVEIRSNQNGEKIFLGDIAKVEESYDDNAKLGRHSQVRAIEMHVRRSPNKDALDLADIVDGYLEKKIPTLPPTVKVEIYDEWSDLIVDRIMLLLWNGGTGLLIVVAVLIVFLNVKLAFWVALGIPISFCATAVVMYFTGQTINMISLFGLIMALGIVVDDAIVVGEHCYTKRDKGLSAYDAAMAGAQRMLAPVTAASLTTVAAFLPLLMIGGPMGAIMGAIPMVVIAVIVASLFECFLILPSHMHHALKSGTGKPWKARVWFDSNFNAFRDGPFRRFVAFTLQWRWPTFATAIAILIVSIGMMAGGRLGFTFFPTPEANNLFGNITFAPGTPRDTVQEMVDELERAAKAAEHKLTSGAGGLIVLSFGRVGETQGEQFQTLNGNHFGGIHLQLINSDSRTVRNTTFIDTWRNEIRPMPGLERIAFTERLGGPPGREIDIQMAGRDMADLKQAAIELRAALETYSGISDVDDNLPYGKPDLLIKVTPRGKAMGFTSTSVGRQVRDRIQGSIAQRFARGDEEVEVRVFQDRDGMSEGDLRELWLKSPGGQTVALSEVATLIESRGFARIQRRDGARVVSVTAEVNEDITSSNQVLDSLKAGELATVAAKYNLTWDLRGKAEEQSEAQGDMLTGFYIGIGTIYLILAWTFGSYGRPFAVMVIIPFGFVGAVLGHYLMGYNLTILSQVGLIGLSGILVNDSIILVTTIDERIKNGEKLFDAIVDGACDRLRAILLTSLTTIGGLLPLLFETSLQAQFLIPMALTMVFGLAIATLLVLIIVPALIGILHDLDNSVGRLFTKDHYMTQPGE